MSKNNENYRFRKSRGVSGKATVVLPCDADLPAQGGKLWAGVFPAIGCPDFLT